MRTNDVAIIGISFEFPKVDNLADLWLGLLKGECFYTIEDCSSQEDIPAWGSVKDRQGFDYRFFGYSYKEACKIDPQQRLLLQHCWHALENAGYMNLHEMPVTSVFAAASINNYLHNNLRQLDPNNEDEVLLGNINDFIATRIAYKLNLQGPALNIQCGCSSGLACIHEARVSLLTKQCDLSLVGAVSLSAPHDHGYPFCLEGIRSANGQIRPFDFSANGTVFTNGIAVLVLKRFVDAERDGDHIYGVIASSAMNNDGSQKASFTAPTIDSQAKVIKRAMRLAKITPEDFLLVEAHGAGTALGDPIEFEGLCRAFGKTDFRGFCALQSVKANIGHLDTASGLAGLIKAMLVLENHTLPPQIHFQKANSKINFVDSPFAINTEMQTCRAEGKVVGVTALGMGGTNAHVIMRHYANKSARKKDEKEAGLILISAKSKCSFEQLGKNYRDFHESHHDQSFLDVSYTSIVGRSHFDYRKAVWIEKERPFEKEIRPEIASRSKASVVYLFPGQGSQYVRMGYQLYHNSSLFKKKLDRSLEILKDLSGRSFKDSLFNLNDQSLYQTEYTQPVLFAFEVSLAHYLMDIGISPDALLGHSLGEYVALVISGALDFEQALKLVLKRGELMSQTGPGAMLSVLADKETLEQLLPHTLDIAAYNAPQLVTVSGSTRDIEEFAAQCRSKEIFTQLLPTKHAFHSSHLDSILEEYREGFSGICFKEPQIPIISNVDCRPLTYERLSQVEYWLEQMRCPVHFTLCIRYLQELYSPIFLEVGPGTTLKTLTAKTIKGSALIVNTLPHPKDRIDDVSVILQTLGKLWEKGVEIDWLKGFDSFSGCKRVHLPTYPFEQKKCWIEPSKKAKPAVIKAANYKRFWKQATEEFVYKQQDSKFLWVLLSDDPNSVREIAAWLESKGGATKTLSFCDFCDRTGKLCHNSFKAFIKRMQDSLLPVKVVHTINSELYDNHTWDEKKKRGLSFILYFFRYCRQLDQNQKIQEYITLTNSSCSFLSELDPDIALLHSIIKTVNQENPRIKSRLIDISPFVFNDEVIHEIGRDHQHSIVLLRDGERFTEKFEEIEFQPSVLPIKRTGVIVILGGLGHVGTQYAEALLQITDQPLMLIQKSPVSCLSHPESSRDKKKSSALNRLKSLAPGRIHVFSADMTKEQQMRNLCQLAVKSFGSIDSIIHTAGVDASMHYKLMKDVDETFIDECFLAKRCGLINMSRIAQEFKINHCHIISSISSILAGVGMYVYSGIHGYIDSYVEAMRKTHPSKWTSVNWEAWDVGANDQEPHEFQQGFFGKHLDELAIKPSDGISIIKDFWYKISGSFIISSSELNERYSQWVEGAVTSTDLFDNNNKDSRPDLFVPYVQASTKEEKGLCGIWSNVLGLEQVGIDDNFFDLGGHSLMALQMTQIINKKFNVAFSIIDLFEFPTVRKLATKISQGKSSDYIQDDLTKRLKAKRERLWQVAGTKKK